MSQVERVVVHNRHVVGIPTNGTTHMQHDFGRKQQQRGNLVGDTFGQMEVTGIESHDLIVLHAVTQIKIIRPHGITLGSDTEKFGFDTIFHVPVLGSENTVERLFQQLTIIEPVDGRIFGTVVNPKIHDTRIVLIFSHLVGDPPATTSMFYPKFTNRIVGIGKCKHAAFRVGKRSGIKIELQSVLFGPLHPTGKVIGSNLVTIDLLTAEIAIHLVQIDAMRTGQQRFHFKQIGTHFVDIASFTGIISRSLYSAGQFAVGIFKSRNIVGLPAMQRQRYSLHFFQHFVHVYAYGGITFGGILESRLHGLFILHDILLSIYNKLHFFLKITYFSFHSSVSHGS